MGLGRLFNIFGTTLLNPRFRGLEKYMSQEDSKRLENYIKNWEFFNGEHFARIDMEDKPEIVHNWCRKLINLYTAVEVNPGINFKFNEKVEEVALPFLNDVWKDNSGDALMSDVFQMKDICGDGFALVELLREGDADFYDPYDEFDGKMIKIYHVPSNLCFPLYKPGYDDVMDSCTVMYPKTFTDGVKIVRNVYYPDRTEEYIDDYLQNTVKNPYGVIPIFHFKNIPSSEGYYGISDLEDIIPLNVELNLKKSDFSEILEYHSSPVTCIFGARVQQLDRGANKVWSGLPKDGKVQNLELNGDLSSSSDYIADTKKCIQELGSAPPIAMGTQELPANISGVALSTAFLPLTLNLGQKRIQTAKTLLAMNKLLLKIGVKEGMISIPDGVKNKVFYNHEVMFGDVLPKDKKMEVEQVQVELKAGVESRKNAMKRLKKDNIESLIKEIDADREENPLIYGVNPVSVTAGQKLVNPETGKVIIDNPAPQPPANSTNSNNKTDKKPVGTNAKGEDININSGVNNFNPGKKTE